MSLRVCPEPGCGELTNGGRCTDCKREHEKARGTKQQRGYDAEHGRIRARLLADLIDGTPCEGCGEPMRKGQALDAAHPRNRPLRLDPTSRADHLEHAPCNRGDTRS